MNITAIAASFISGLVGAMGLGGGSVLIIYLTGVLEFNQKEAQGINLIFFISTGIFALIKNTRYKLTDNKALVNLLKCALPGLAAGFILLPFIPTAILKKLFGGALLILGMKTLLSKE